MTILLNASAAASCPVKTQHAFSHVPLWESTRGESTRGESTPGGSTPEVNGHPRDLAAAAREQSRRAHRERILDGWLRRIPGALDLRGPADEPIEARAELCRQALAAGRPLIVAGTLPVDPGAGRIGVPDLLLRGPDQVDGRPGYRPIVVKWHRIIFRPRPPAPGPHEKEDQEDPAPSLLPYGTVEAPGPEQNPPLTGYRARLTYREHDFLQLAHYVRLLAAAGHGAPGPAWAGVIGTDEPPEELTGRARLDDQGADGGLIAWVDLAEPAIRIQSPSGARGWALRSLLDRYDAEHEFRLAIAEVARRQTGQPGDPPLLVDPIVNDECPSCPWWSRCRARLDDQDVSLRIERGPLDAREIITLRRAGIVTVPQLADADVDDLLLDYLPQVSHRADAEPRLRTAARRAQMLITGIGFERETDGPVEVPDAEIEIDFDLETAVDGRIYLWGFRVQERPRCDSAPAYVRQFAAFADLDEEAETALAREALGWLREQISGPRSVRVYHYSGFEVAMLKALANRSGEELLRWAADYADSEFVDLLQLIKAHYFGVSGLGLKSIAQHAGFRWRDADPGGLNSQVWFAEAVHGTGEAAREQARRRVLQYNEDDVAATGWLRAWLRGL